ncbi:MAG: hypothetical protein BWY95_01841 [Bacteroidetes bacterium ADurb.BinA104]|nr:MAG: hypothetical protein BWY95_01841 [Bacteroidetes bacterium ADurb.BinA104]
MLIIDLHTLQAIYILNLINNILLNSCWTFDGKYVGRGYSTVRERGTRTYKIALLNKNLLGKSY